MVPKGKSCPRPLSLKAGARRMAALAGLILTVAATTGQCQHAAIEAMVFVDPMEADTIPQWQRNSCEVEAAEDIVEQGAACLKLTDQGSNAQAFIRLEATPGLRYRVQVSAYRHASNTGAWLGCAAVSFAGGEGSSSTYASRSDFIAEADRWCDLSLEFDARAQRVFIVLAGQNATGDVTRFDNVRVICVGVPEVIPTVTGEPRHIPAASIELVGSPAEIGARWGELNAQAIREDMAEYYMDPAAKAGVTEAELIRRSGKFVTVARELAPHWIEESEAIAVAAGVDPELYLSFVASVYRGIWRGEDCTSYAVAPEFAEDGRIFFHKNRDNVPKRQCAFIIDTQVPEVNKFIAVSDASVIACMMMVNEKGLAGSADVGRLKVEEPRYRGWMNTSLLRHIAERASDCEEALAIIEQSVRDGYCAGGKRATHWLFVDRNGAILEVRSNSTRVEHQYHEEKVYFSADRDSAITRAQELPEPIDFAAFHNVSRDPATCFPQTIAGMSVEISRERPDFLTVAWITMPARSLAFPLFMGGVRTPEALLNGEVDLAGRQSLGDVHQWESIEQFAFATQRRMEADVRALLGEGRTEEAREALDDWAASCSRAHLSALGPSQAPAAQ